MPELFAAYVVALESIAEAQDSESQLRMFEMQLMDSLGYALALEHEAHSGIEIQPERQYRYELDAGPRRLEDAENGPTISGRTLLQMAARKLEGSDSLREAKTLMRALVDLRLGGRSLRTRELLRRPAHEE